MKKLLITILILAPFIAQAQLALGTGLVGYWPMDRRDLFAGQGTIYDRSGNNNSGILIATATSTGKIGQGFTFNGTSARIQLPQSSILKPSGGITISAWVKPDVGSLGAGGTLREVYRKEDGNDRTLFSFQNSGNCAPASGTGCFTLGISTGAGVYAELDAPVTSASLEGKWSLMTATYDLATKKIYLNGSVIGTAAATGNITTTNTAAGFIGSLSGTTEFFKGKIDDLRIYNRALSQAEINALYREGSGLHDGSFLGTLLASIGGLL